MRFSAFLKYDIPTIISFIKYGTKKGAEAPFLKNSIISYRTTTDLVEVNPLEAIRTM